MYVPSSLADFFVDQIHPIPPQGPGQSSLHIKMSYPNQYSKEHEAGFTSYGYYENPAGDYSYDDKSSRTKFSEPGELTYPRQPTLPYEAVPKSYGFFGQPAPRYTYDEKRGGDDPSQPLLRSTEKSSKVPKWVMPWMEEDELAKDIRLRREAWDRRFSTTDRRNLYCYKNSDIKSALECMAGRL